MIKFELKDYQIEGVEFIKNAMEEYSCCILGDVPGLGKTIQGIQVIVENNFKTLIICPSYLKINWMDEINKFSNLNAMILESSSKITTIEDLDPYDVIVINYETTFNKKLYPFLYHTKFDLVICDESQYLKTYSAKRTAHTASLLKHHPRRLLSTGTPLKNKPEDAFTQLNAIMETYFDDSRVFKRNFCNNPKLFQKTISPFYIRRTKEEVLKDLPPVFGKKIIFELSKQESEDYQKIFNGPKSKGSALVAITKSKQFLANKKLNYVIDITDDLISQGEKVVIFTQYRKIIQDLNDYYGDVSVIHQGGMKNSDRQNNIKSFQEDPSKTVLIANLATAVGYNATSSSHVIFLDLPWSPADRQQSIDRLHRIGQKNPVNVYYPLFKETLDEYIHNLLEFKQDLVGKFTEKFKDQSILQKIIELFL